jgi:hypothetical protein
MRFSLCFPKNSQNKNKIQATGKFNLMTESITLQIPDPLYQRLASTAQATHRPLE